MSPYSAAELEKIAALLRHLVGQEGITRVEVNQQGVLPKLNLWRRRNVEMERWVELLLHGVPHSLFIADLPSAPQEDV